MGLGTGQYVPSTLMTGGNEIRNGMWRDDRVWFGTKGGSLMETCTGNEQSIFDCANLVPTHACVSVCARAVFDLFPLCCFLSLSSFFLADGHRGHRR